MRHFQCAAVWFAVCNLSVLVFSVPAFAQDAPKAEIFAGFSYGTTSSSQVPRASRIRMKLSLAVPARDWASTVGMGRSRST